MLLDITNLQINAVNHGYDPFAFLDQLPMERVVQLHFVGGHLDEGVLIDSHSHSTPPEVWNLMKEILARVPVKGIVLERDDNFPAFKELLNELEQARNIGRAQKIWD